MVHGVHDAFMNLKVNDEAVKQAKQRVKATILMSSESGGQSNRSNINFCLLVC